MPESDLIWMTALVFLPALFALGLLAFPARWVEGMRWFALVGSAATLSASLCVLIGYYTMLDSRLDKNGRPMHSVHTRLDNRADQAASDAAKDIPRYLSDDWVARRSWINRFDIDFALGVDGISLPLIILTAIVTFLAIVASWKIEKSVRGYLALVLLLETGVIGAFLALDFVLFYFFYEVMLVPMYFLIGLWGGGRRKYAALKFVIYTLLGSVCLLVAMIAMYTVNVRDFVDQDEVRRAAGIVHADPLTPADQKALDAAEVHSFDFVTLSKAGRAVMLILNGHEDRIGVKSKPSEEMTADDSQVRLFAPGVDREKAIERLKSQSVCTKQFQYIMFVLLFLGFAVKVPIVPLHSWLPDAHVEAPTPISMILAGVLLKLGGYGLIRVAFPLCPLAEPHGIRGAGPGRVVGGFAIAILVVGRERGRVPDGGPRHHGVRDVLRRGRDLRPCPPPRPEQIRRPVRTDAALLGRERRDLLRVDGLAGAVRLRGRTVRHDGGVELLAGAGDPRDPQRGPHRGLPAVGLAARLLRHEPSHAILPGLDAARSRRAAALRGAGNPAGRVAEPDDELDRAERGGVD